MQNVNKIKNTVAQYFTHVFNIIRHFTKLFIKQIHFENW